MSVTSWQYHDKVSALQLDPSCRRDSATQAEDASSTGQIATAGAVWLAVNGLPLFPLYPGRNSPITSGWWSDKEFEYVTWKHPLCLEVVRSLCGAKPHTSMARYGVSLRWRSRAVEAGKKGWQLLNAEPGAINP